MKQAIQMIMTFMVSVGLFVLIIFGMAVTSVWYVESRFGTETVAIIGVGGVLVALAILTVSGIFIGWRMNQANTTATMQNMVDFAIDLGQINRANTAVQKEYARADAAHEIADAKIRVMETNYAAKMGRQYAALLVDAEKQKWEGQRKLLEAKPERPRLMFGGVGGSGYQDQDSQDDEFDEDGDPMIRFIS